jgi:hypothetical protein
MERHVRLLRAAFGPCDFLSAGPGGERERRHWQHRLMRRGSSLTTSCSPLVSCQVLCWLAVSGRGLRGLSHHMAAAACALLPACDVTFAVSLRRLHACCFSTTSVLVFPPTVRRFRSRPIPMSFPSRCWCHPGAPVHRPLPIPPACACPRMPGLYTCLTRPCAQAPLWLSDESALAGCNLGVTRTSVRYARQHTKQKNRFLNG